MISCAYFYARDGAYFYARDGAYFYGTLNLFSLICGERRDRRLGRHRVGGTGDCDRRCCHCEIDGEGAAPAAARTAALVRIALRERGGPGVPTLDEDWRYEIVTHQMIGAVWAYIYIYIIIY